MENYIHCFLKENSENMWKTTYIASWNNSEIKWKSTHCLLNVQWQHLENHIHCFFKIEKWKHLENRIHYLVKQSNINNMYRNTSNAN